MIDEKQARCLRALLDTVIPADDYPSGWEAGVGDYLMGQLNGDLAAMLPSYQLWLHALDTEAEAVTGKPFADLNLGERSELLKAIESGGVETVWSIEPAGFFHEIVEHCSEGYYSDPGNGGNRDGVAWRMIGFEVSR